MYVPPYFLVPDLPNGTERSVQIVNLLMTHLCPPLSYLLPVALHSNIFSHTCSQRQNKFYTPELWFFFYFHMYILIPVFTDGKVR